MMSTLLLHMGTFCCLEEPAINHGAKWALAVEVVTMYLYLDTSKLQT